MKLKRALTEHITFVLIFTFLIYSISGCSFDSVQRNLDLGYKYLEEGNYSEALIAFEKVITIDDKNIDGYMGKAQALIGLDNISDAVTTIETAIILASTYEQLEMLEEYKQVVEWWKNNADTSGEIYKEIKTILKDDNSDILGIWSHHLYEDDYSVMIFDDKTDTVTVRITAIRGNGAQIATANVENVKFINGVANFPVVDSFGNQADCCIKIEDDKLTITYTNEQLIEYANWGVMLIPDGHYVKTEELSEVSAERLESIRQEIEWERNN